jgi:hypothetical protein
MDERSGVEDTAAPEQEQAMSDRKKAESHVPARCRGKGPAANTAASHLMRLAPKMSGKIK